jgi:hypothetical protein
MGRHGGLTIRRSWHGPASARRPSRLEQRKRDGVTPPASRASHAGKAARRIGFGTWALAAQLSACSVSPDEHPEPTRKATEMLRYRFDMPPQAAVKCAISDSKGARILPCVESQGMWLRTMDGPRILLWAMQLLVINVVLFALLLLAGGKLSARFGRRLRVIIGICIIAVCLPAGLYSIYYLHLFDGWLWFFQLRSYELANYYPATLGLLAGWILPAMASGSARTVVVTIAAIFVTMPFAKPLVSPLNPDELHELWHEGVCIQSTSSTCGPASVATVLAQGFRDRVSERAVAQAAHTTRTGTEVWYLAQFLRARGYTVTFRTDSREPLPYAIAGTHVGAAGHFVAVLACTDQDCQVADPLTGRIQSEKLFVFSGFYMQIAGGIRPLQNRQVAQRQPPRSRSAG